MSRAELALGRVGTPVQVLERHGIVVRRKLARCPFHPDDSPSLSCFTGRDGKARWKCHGCDVGGDALDLESMLSGRPLGEVISRWA